MSDFLHLSATRLAALIRSREVSPVEVVDAHIRQIEAVNPRLNAVVVPRFEAALRDAREAETKLMAAEDPRELPPLLGVPCTIKEMISVEGMPNTIGSHYRRDHIATENATVVDRILGAGAIPLGLTNIPEMALWVETSNVIYGRTNNPYDPRRTSGGSSGGEAAIIAAGGSPFGIGSDGGGSIRTPAHYCGIFGHKPTGGLVPLTGHYPLFKETRERFARSERLHYITIGPMTRMAEDLKPLLLLLAGPDGVDPMAREFPGWREKAYERGALPEEMWKGRRVYVCSDPRFQFASRASSEVQAAVKRAAGVFAGLGAQLTEFDPTILRGGFELWGTLFGSAEGQSFEEAFFGGKSPRWGAELLAMALRRPRTSLPVLMTAIGEKIVPKGARLERLLEGARDLQRKMGELLDDAILILPVMPTVAPFHMQPLLRPFDTGYAAVINVLKLPATSVPLGLGEKSRMPVGVQIIAAQGADLLSIEAAGVIERALGGWRMPQ